MKERIVSKLLIMLIFSSILIIPNGAEIVEPFWQTNPLFFELISSIIPSDEVNQQTGGSTCWVNSFNETESTWWFFTGSTPYLHNNTESYITSLGVGNCSFFEFENTSLTDLQTVYLMIEWRTREIKPNEEARLYLSDSVSEVEIGSFNLTLEHSWTKLNVTEILDTIVKVNEAKLKIESTCSGLYQVVSRRAYLRIYNGPIPIAYGTPLYGKAAGQIILSTKWSDSDGLSSYALNHNASGIWLTENITGVFSGKEAWSNHTITLPSDTASVVAYRFWANDTGDNWDKTDVLFVYPVKNFSPNLLRYIEDVDGSPIAHSYGRKDHFDNASGRLWKFFSDGTNIRYTSSTDGQVWNSSESIRAAERGYMFYVHTSNGTVHYTYNSELPGEHIYYRKGSLSSNGNITWVTTEQIVIEAETSQRFYVCSIITDTEGYPYITFGNRTDTNHKTLNLIRSNFSNGTWHTSSGFPKQVNEDPDGDLISGISLDLLNSDIYVIYCSAGDEEPPRGRLCSESTLGPIENASDHTMSSNYLFSAISDDYGDVHLVYRRDSSRVDYSFRNYTNGQWEIKDELVTSFLTDEALGMSAYSWPVIGWNTELNEIYVHWWTLEDKSAWLKIRNSTTWEARRRILKLNDEVTLIDGDVITPKSWENQTLINFVLQDVEDGRKEVWAYLYKNIFPTANFTESAEIVYTGESITFNASSSYDPDGTIISFHWNFGDGENATGEVTTHSYDDDGNYTVTLKVMDDDMANATATSEKTVLNRPPVANFTESVHTVFAGDPIYFNASGSYDLDGVIVNYFWDFGDGTNETGVESCSHFYVEGGNYTVTLTVTDDDDSTDSTIAVKEVFLRPDLAVLSVNVSKTVVGEGYNVTVKVVVENQGDSFETLNITIYATSTLIMMENITLDRRESATLNFTWDTSDWEKGNYTVNAFVNPVEEELDTGDNLFSDGLVLITIAGDVDGDKDIDIYDIVSIATTYGIVAPDPMYQSNNDIDGDGDIDIYDVVAAAGNYGKSW